MVFLIAIIVANPIAYITSPDDAPWTLKLIMGISIILLLGCQLYQLKIKENQRQERVDKAESNYKEHPDNSKAAWDFSQIKLESYIDRNLDQVRWIFYLSVIVMLVGCGIIIHGILLVYSNPSEITPAVIISISGIITQIIGGTLLIIYKSTMRQAKEYVQILERMSAVGMSVQMIDKHSEDNEAKNLAFIEMAKLVLQNYSR